MTKCYACLELGYSHSALAVHFYEINYDNETKKYTALCKKHRFWKIGSHFSVKVIEISEEELEASQLVEA